MFLSSLTLNVLYHTIPHELCRFEMKDMHGFQCVSSVDADGLEGLLFIFCLKSRNFLLSF